MTQPPTSLRKAIAKAKSDLSFAQELQRRLALPLTKSLPRAKKKTSFMKKQKQSGEKTEPISTASDAKLLEVTFGASENQREIHITFKDERGSSCMTQKISLPAVKGAMIISTPTPLGDMNVATFALGGKGSVSSVEPILSRHDWGTGE